MKKDDVKVINILKDHFLFAYNETKQIYGCNIFGLSKEEAEFLLKYFHREYETGAKQIKVVKACPKHSK